MEAQLAHKTEREERGGWVFLCLTWTCCASLIQVTNLPPPSASNCTHPSLHHSLSCSAPVRAASSYNEIAVLSYQALLPRPHFQTNEGEIP